MVSIRRTAPFDAAEHLDNPEVIAHYLSEALATEDPEFIARAIGTVARAQGMTNVAREAGINRENLYRALGAGAHPEFDTVIRVLRALGVQLEAKPKPKRARPKPKPKRDLEHA
jgi:probable addiction module antidote protein